jgi:hypothetical protein
MYVYWFIDVELTRLDSEYATLDDVPPPPVGALGSLLPGQTIPHSAPPSYEETPKYVDVYDKTAPGYNPKLDPSSPEFDLDAVPPPPVGPLGASKK